MRPPRLTKRGVYHPVELLDYLEVCIAENVPNEVIAYELGLPLHRVIYATGEGYPYFKRQAAIYSMVEKGCCA